MSESLRDALENLAGELEYAVTGAPAKIRALLAAHPAPDRQPSDAAVEAALEVLFDHGHSGRPRTAWTHPGPLLDREAVWRGIYAAAIQHLNPSGVADKATDAVMELLNGDGA